MPINSLVNRYRDLVLQIPAGSFYSNDGNIVPMRDNPYTLLFTTDTVNQQYGIFVNDIFQGVVQSDTNGNVVVGVLLKLGENQLSLVNGSTQERVVSYITTRNYATWLAAVAENFEQIDDSIDQTQLDSVLATSSSSSLEEVWGVRANQANVGYSDNAYRDLLQALLLGYRLFGAKLRGVELAVAAFTQVPPLDLFRRFDGKRWILGTDFIQNRTFDTVTYSFDPVPSVPGVILTSVGFVANPGLATLGWNPPTTPIVTGTVNLGSLTYGVGGTVDGLTLVLSNEAATFQIIKFSKPASDGDLAEQITTQAMGIVATVDGSRHLVLTSTLTGRTSYIRVDRYSTSLAQLGLMTGTTNGVDGVASYLDPVLGTFTTNVSPRRDGDYSIPGPSFPAAIVSLSGPFLIDAPNQIFELDIDRRGLIRVTLPLGAQSSATLAGVINTALNLDPRYGAFYNATATVHGSRFKLVSTVSGTIALYKINNELSTLFGLAGSEYRRGYDTTLATVRVVNASTASAFNSQSFQLYLSVVPEPWYLLGAVSDVVARVPQQFSTGPQALQITATGSGDISLYQKAIPQANRYKEFLFDWGVWLSPTTSCTVALGWSFDNGVSWFEAPVEVLTRFEDVGQSPEFLSAAFRYVAIADSLIVRIRISGLTVGQTILIDGARLIQKNISAMFLANNTIIRSRHRSFFGHLLYAWCSDPLSVDESNSIGLGSPPNWPNGAIDFIGAAHTQTDRFNVTEFDLVTGTPLNLKGVITEGDWSATTLTNLEIQIRDPLRAAFVSPSVAGTVIDTLLFPNAPPYNATLSVISDQDPLSAILFQDGIPLPNDSWSFVDESTINILNGSYSANSVWTFQYTPLWRAESGVVDLGPNFQDYVWYADHYRFTRFDAAQTETQRTIPLFLNFSTFQAILDRPALTDVAKTTIIRNNGLEEFQLPEEAYIWIDQYTIRIAAQFVIPTALYTMTYFEIGMKNEELPEIVFETRGALLPGGLAATPYRLINRNDPLETSTGDRYFQFRLTVTNIADVRDFRLSSMVAKGLNVFGSQGVPGLVTPQDNIPREPVALSPILFSAGGWNSPLSSTVRQILGFRPATYTKIGTVTDIPDSIVNLPQLGPNNYITTMVFDRNGNAWVMYNLFPNVVGPSPGTVIARYSLAKLTSGGSPQPDVVITLPDGTFSSTAFITAATFDSVGNLWIAGRFGLFKYAASSIQSSGSPTPTVAIGSVFFAQISELQFDSDGYLYVLDYKNVPSLLKLSPAELSVSNPILIPAVQVSLPGVTVVPPGHAGPDGLAIDSQGFVWIADYDRSNIKKYSPASLSVTGTPTALVTLNLVTGGPNQISFDTLGNLWVAMFDANTVICIAASDLLTSGIKTPRTTLTGDGTPPLSPWTVRFSLT